MSVRTQNSPSVQFSGHPPGGQGRGGGDMAPGCPNAAAWGTASAVPGRTLCLLLGLALGISPIGVRAGNPSGKPARPDPPPSPARAAAATCAAGRDCSTPPPAPRPAPPPPRMRVVLTGGAGYIGSHCALRLLEQGHRVTIVDDLSRGNHGALRVLRDFSARRRRQGKASEFNFVHGDVGDRAVLRRAFRGRARTDLVIHFAAIAYVGESMSEPLKYYRNITVNTVTLMEELAAAEVPRLVFSSTCAVYGNPKRLPVTEATPPRPMSPYGAAKLVSERIISDAARATPGLLVGILRYFNVYGCDPMGRLGEWPRPHLQQKHGRITNACLDAAQGTIPRIRVMGTRHPTKDGSCVRDFIHVMDLVDAHIMLVPKVASPPALYNVGTGHPVSVRELVRACRQVTEINFPIEEVPQPRAGDMAEVYADPKLIKAELGWRPKYLDVRDGLRHCWRWRTAHPTGYAAGGEPAAAGGEAAAPPPAPPHAPPRAAGAGVRHAAARAFARAFAQSALPGARRGTT